MQPGLFVGTLRHRRHTPVEHVFTYPLFMAGLDIDRIPELMRVSRLTAHNRLNWATFDDRDHFGDPRLPLRQRVRAAAAGVGIDLPDGPIFLLTHLRYVGYCFNPVSFFYAFDAANALKLVIAEVNNTFGGSQTYWLRPDHPDRPFQAAATKSLHVSPFLPMDVGYRFRFTSPGDHLGVHISVTDSGSTVFDATLTLDRRPWTAQEIRRQLFRQPAMTAVVTAAIHWQALRLWWKGVPTMPCPAESRRVEVLPVASSPDRSRHAE